jgi:beta-lactamase superfamily II metal-dependent hydrolase
MAKVFMLTEASPFMMGFVVVTAKNNAIVIDGGRPADMPLLKKLVGGRKILAWILTHGHDDHISGFVDEMEKDGGSAFDIVGVYDHFLDYDALMRLPDSAVPEPAYFHQELNEMMPAFNKVLPLFKEKNHLVNQGDELQFDDVHLSFLYSAHPGLYANLMNDSSLVFKMTGEKSDVLFLADLGPQGGDYLLRESKDKLHATYCQMAHHGHMGVGMEVYAAIAPKVCLWCAPKWLYEEPVMPDYLADGNPRNLRMYGTALTREWMAQLGVKKHLVSGDGVQEFEI